MILRTRCSNGLKMLLLGIISLTFFISHVNALAVMSVDLGSEWMKVAVVSVSSPKKSVLKVLLTFEVLKEPLRY
jgi:hypothetical protein